MAVGIDLDVFHRRFLRRAFISALGYTPNQYDSFCAHAFEIERRGAGAGTRDEQGAADTEADEYAVQLVVNSPRVTALVESSSAPDPRILGEVIQALDRATLTWGDAFPREKRGKLIAAL